jgi:hypothetical protein
VRTSQDSTTRKLLKQGFGYNQGEIVKFTATLLFCLRTSSAWVPSPSSTRKRKAVRSDSIRSIGLAKDHEFNVRWLQAACRVLKSDGTLWATGTHHVIFSLRFALQWLGFRIMTSIVRQ